MPSPDFARLKRPPAGWWQGGLQVLGDPYFTVPLPLLGAGVAYPGGRLPNNAWDGLDFDSTTNLSTVTDMTAAVQAAHDALAQSGLGGVIVLGPGVWRLNGVNITAGGISVKGAGWGEYQGSFGQFTPAKRSKIGTYILTDNPAQSAFVVGANANNVVISDLAFIQPQPPDAGGWTPTKFAPSIQINGVAASVGGSVLIERCLFWGVYQGIQVASSNTNAGRITLRDLELATFSGYTGGVSYGGIQVNSCDALTIDNCNFYPQLLQGSPNQQSYIGGNATCIIVGTATVASIANVSIYGASVGILLNGNYATQGGSTGARIRINNVGFELVYTAISEIGFDVSYQVTGMSAIGIFNSVGSAIASSGANAVIDVVSMYASTYANSIVSITSTSADVRFGPNCRFDRWNQASVGSAAINAAAGAVVYYWSHSRFTNGGGGAGTSGAGTFTAY